MVKNIVILGSTGSIGQNALRVIDALGEEYKVLALKREQQGRTSGKAGQEI